MAAKSPPAGLRRPSLPTAHTLGLRQPGCPPGRGKVSSHQNTAGRVGDLRGHDHGETARTRGTVPRRGWEHAWSAWRIPYNFISHTLRRCLLRACSNWFGKTAPVLPGSAGRQSFSPAVSRSPFRLLYIHTEAERFPLLYTAFPRKL